MPTSVSSHSPTLLLPALTPFIMPNDELPILSEAASRIAV